MSSKINTLLVSGLLLSTFIPIGMAADTASSNSKVTGSVKAGQSELEVQDVDFGPLKIGQTTGMQKVTKDYIRVLDLSGGDGWDLSVEQLNYEKHKDNVITSMKMGADYKPFITSATHVMRGESRNENQFFDGDLKLDWGTNPRADKYQADLKWTLTPQILTQADRVKNTMYSMNELIEPNYTEGPEDFYGREPEKIFFDKGSNSLITKQDVSEFFYTSQEDREIELADDKESFISHFGSLDKENPEWYFTGEWELSFSIPYNEFKTIDFSEGKTDSSLFDIVEYENEDVEFKLAEDDQGKSKFMEYTYDGMNQKEDITLHFKDGSSFTFTFGFEGTGSPYLKK